MPKVLQDAAAVRVVSRRVHQPLPDLDVVLQRAAVDLGAGDGELRAAGGGDAHVSGARVCAVLARGLWFVGDVGGVFCYG